tara:strand:+ start:2748 stop:3350 length:603 start_codon:yes stop_codon:yes gene_type:complete
MPDPVKKKKGKTAAVAKKRKKRVAPTGNQGMKRNSKKKPVNTTSAPAGYSKRTRMDMAAKKALSGGVSKKTRSSNQRALNRSMDVSAKEALSGGVAKKKAGQTGYGPQNRLGTFAKKKKVKTTGPRKKGYMKDAAAIAKGPKKKAGSVKKGKVKKGKVYTTPQGPRHLALKKRADARDKKPKKKKAMSVAQLRKAGKIQF